MTRSSVASITLAAVSVLLSVGACNREGPSTPSGHFDSALLRATLGTASAIPLQRCDHALPAQPLRMGVADAAEPRPRPLSTTVPLPAWLRLAAWRSGMAECNLPPYTQQENAMPLTNVNPAMEF